MDPRLATSLSPSAISDLAYSNVCKNDQLILYQSINRDKQSTQFFATVH